MRAACEESGAGACGQSVDGLHGEDARRDGAGSMWQRVGECGGSSSRVRSGGGVKGERKTEATARARNIYDRWARDFP